MISILDKSLQVDQQAQHSLIQAIENYLPKTQKYRANLRRFSARLEAHKNEYFELGLQIVYYKELHLVINAAIQISSMISEALFGFLPEQPSLANKYKSIVEKYQTSGVLAANRQQDISDQLIYLATIKDQINKLFADLEQPLLQNLFFQASKAAYMARYFSKVFKQKDRQLALLSVGNNEILASKFFSIDKICRLVKRHMFKTIEFFYNLEKHGLGIKVETFKLVLMNSDSLVKYRLYNHNIEKILVHLLASYPHKINYVTKRHFKFQEKCDYLTKLILHDIKVNQRLIIDNKNFEQIIIQKLIELLVQNAVYYLLAAEEPGSAKFQTELLTTIENSIIPECRLLIFTGMAAMLKLKQTNLLKSTEGIDKINELAQNFIAAARTAQADKILVKT